MRSSYCISSMDCLAIQLASKWLCGAPMVEISNEGICEGKMFYVLI
ncbi:MAG: hypothetical protein SNJ33_03210 [Rikenellaceae bacterium]